MRRAKPGAQNLSNAYITLKFRIFCLFAPDAPRYISTVPDSQHDPGYIYVALPLLKDYKGLSQGCGRGVVKFEI